MQLEGKNTIRSDQETVWHHLNSPVVLARVIPGCQEIHEVEKDSYHGVVKLGVGPVKGSYEVDITITDGDPPTSCQLHIEGKGKAGFITAVSWVTLHGISEKETEMEWRGTGQAGGPLAAAGDRLLIGIGKMLINKFFKSIEEEILKEEKGCEASSV